MDLDKRQRQVLIELCNKGFVANWYHTFGNYRLKVYKQDSTDEYITLHYKGFELEVGTYFPGISFLSSLNEEKLESYREAISVYESIIGPKVYKG